MKNTILITLLVFIGIAACKKEERTLPASGVDKIVGTYEGIVFDSSDRVWVEMTSDTTGIEHTTHTDTSYALTVIIEKAGSDSFLIVSAYPWGKSTEEFYKPIRYNPTNIYADKGAVVSFSSDNNSICIDTRFGTSISSDQYFSHTLFSGKK
jgi:hypothetical protein